ncbi:MAG: hypothetical protein KKF85_08060 [Gammaproteobacteria bacterium]|nr:hypothetical protein [Rhodocyclaceae bacterium]MBU3910152.1 hypothetical protein [Gammaproteobacteria bacterium]MBU4006159.1 hypothetical protein [Gammaproteobacteria bacterium]MBU4022614.1 hypothetical protein [Gammaproteobacteria bacterium]MBU4097114.1 hypothetical protein [Gammaproteobacteria bacterium]
MALMVVKQIERDKDLGSELDMPSASDIGSEWSVAVFAARESPQVILATLDAVINATCKRTTVDLLINGNSPLANKIAETLSRHPITSDFAKVRLWHIQLGDKAHAWNQFIHHLWPQGTTAFFVDGYVQPAEKSFAFLADGVNSSEQVFGSAGLPSSGRTAPQLRQQIQIEHSLHGNLFSLKPSVILRIKKIGFRLPLGIYRTDAVLEAALKFSFDPEHNDWNIDRVFIHPQVTWATPAKHWWRYSDIKAHLKRMLRQSQGKLEIHAVRYHLAIKKRGAASLPRTALELVLTWIDECPDQAREVLRSFMLRRALSQMRARHDWSSANIPPVLIWPVSNKSE